LPKYKIVNKNAGPQNLLYLSGFGTHAEMALLFVLIDIRNGCDHLLTAFLAKKA